MIFVGPPLGVGVSAPPIFVARCECGCQIRYFYSALEAVRAEPSLLVDCGDAPWLDLPGSQVGHD